jgi:hypothetical protein
MPDPIIIIVTNVAGVPTTVVFHGPTALADATAHLAKK